MRRTCRGGRGPNSTRNSPSIPRIASPAPSPRARPGATFSCPGRLTGDDERLEVELSGLPAFDRNRAFQGYRGFGVCRDVSHVERLAARRRSGAAAADETAPMRQPDATEAETPEPPAKEVAAGARGSPPTWCGFPGAGSFAEMRALETEAAALGSGEHGAFHELARQLTVRLQATELAPARSAAARAPPMEAGRLWGRCRRSLSARHRHSYELGIRRAARPSSRHPPGLPNAAASSSRRRWSARVEPAEVHPLRRPASRARRRAGGWRRRCRLRRAARRSATMRSRARLGRPGAARPDAGRNPRLPLRGAVVRQPDGSRLDRLSRPRGTCVRQGDWRRYFPTREWVRSPRPRGDGRRLVTCHPRRRADARRSAAVRDPLGR